MTRRDRLLLAALVASALYFVVFCEGADGPGAWLGLSPPMRPKSWEGNSPGILPDARQPSFDVYTYYYYPNMLYAVRVVRDGGKGLFWNPFQDCGQPFFGLSGLLYPPNLLFFLLDPDLALRGAYLFDLVVAGVLAYLLGRDLGLGYAGALAGALAFQLGNATLLDIAAGRWIVAEEQSDFVTSAITPMPRLADAELKVRVYENKVALARARFVPGIEVEPNREALLSRLAWETDDPRTVALVDEPPRAGCLGEPRADTPGTAEFIVDDPEHLVVRVEAPGGASCISGTSTSRVGRRP